VLEHRVVLGDLDRVVGGDQRGRGGQDDALGAGGDPAQDGVRPETGSAATSPTGKIPNCIALTSLHIYMTRQQYWATPDARWRRAADGSAVISNER